MDKGKIKSIIGILCTAALCLSFYGTIRVAFHPVSVIGVSMKPTFESGTITKCEPVDEEGDLSRNDIVSYKHDGLRMIKRLIALPGDTVAIENGVLLVNEEPSKYQFEPIDTPSSFMAPVLLGKNEYFCMGDNRNHSTDCRSYGPIPLEVIDYRIIGILFAPGKRGNEN